MGNNSHVLIVFRSLFSPPLIIIVIMIDYSYWEGKPGLDLKLLWLLIRASSNSIEWYWAERQSLWRSQIASILPLHPPAWPHFWHQPTLGMQWTVHWEIQKELGTWEGRTGLLIISTRLKAYRSIWNKLSDLRSWGWGRRSTGTPCGRHKETRTTKELSLVSEVITRVVQEFSWSQKN